MMIYVALTFLTEDEANSKSIIYHLLVVAGTLFLRHPGMCNLSGKLPYYHTTYTITFRYVISGSGSTSVSMLILVAVSTST